MSSWLFLSGTVSLFNNQKVSGRQGPVDYDMEDRNSDQTPTMHKDSEYL